jgi:hypothetical protein
LTRQDNRFSEQTADGAILAQGVSDRGPETNKKIKVFCDFGRKSRLEGVPMVVGLCESTLVLKGIWWVFWDALELESPGLVWWDGSDKRTPV